MSIGDQLKKLVLMEQWGKHEGLDWEKYPQIERDAAERADWEKQQTSTGVPPQLEMEDSVPPLS